MFSSLFVYVYHFKIKRTPHNIYFYSIIFNDYNIEQFTQTQCCTFRLILNFSYFKQWCEDYLMAKYLLVVPGTVISNELAPALMKLASRCNPSGQAHILKYFLRKYSKKIFPKKKVLEVKLLKQSMQFLKSSLVIYSQTVFPKDCISLYQ